MAQEGIQRKRPWDMLHVCSGTVPFHCHHPGRGMLDMNLAEARHSNGPLDHRAYSWGLWIWVIQGQVYFLCCRSCINHIPLSLYHCHHPAFTCLLDSTVDDNSDSDKEGNTILEKLQRWEWRVWYLGEQWNFYSLLNLSHLCPTHPSYIQLKWFKYATIL